jgi:hypothetical protein
MAKPKFIKIFQIVWDNPKIKNLTDFSFKFLIYILLTSYEQRDKNSFTIKPKEIYSEFNISRSTLYRVLEELKGLSIKIDYQHKIYCFNLTDFFDLYYPKCSKNETDKDIYCS